MSQQTYRRMTPQEYALALTPVTPGRPYRVGGALALVPHGRTFGGREEAEGKLAPVRLALAAMFETAMSDAAQAALMNHMPGEDLSPARWGGIAAWLADRRALLDAVMDDPLSDDALRESVAEDVGVVTDLLAHVRHLDGWLAKLSHDCDAFQAGLQAGRREAQARQSDETNNTDGTAAA